MRKKLIIINGAMGVGKSEACRRLNRELGNSVWLDGDWCWMMDPFVVNEENRRMVEDNIAHLLHNFLNNSTYEHVIFSWVIPEESIFETLLRQLSGLDFDLFKISLVCDEATLRRRLMGDVAKSIREESSVNKGVEYLKVCDAMDMEKIDTSTLTVEEVAREIVRHINHAGVLG